MSIVRFCSRGALGALFGAIAAFGPVQAADPAPRKPVAVPPAAAPPAWTFRFTPYGWLTSLDGTQTVRGRSVDVNASFVDIIDATLGSGGTLIGLMADFEARNGPLSFLGDLVWSKIAVERSGVRSRSFSPGIAGAVGVAADL